MKEMFVSENTAAVTYTTSPASLCRVKPDAKPFVKWAGGKKQLLPIICMSYPHGLESTVTKYAEPFVGGGAVLFDILNRYDLEKIYISDINTELITTYKIIRDNCEPLIQLLKSMRDEYVPQSNDARKEIFYTYRTRFNTLKKTLSQSYEELESFNQLENKRIELAALFIFLNRTCFNGLYRVNQKGEFNVPIGSYKNPSIFDEDVLRSISAALKNVEIICADYRESLDFIDEKTFVYIDPPYRPLTKTANFTSYSENEFDDNAQIALAEFVRLIDEKGAKVLLSNSDPKNTDPNDDFFDELYKGFTIQRVTASRMINSKGNSRGKIREILVTNYFEEQHNCSATGFWRQNSMKYNFLLRRMSICLCLKKIEVSLKSDVSSNNSFR